MAGADAERERDAGFRRRTLGEIESARSRHMWTRSAVHAIDDVVVAGRWDGTVTAFGVDSLEPRWSVEHPDHAVGIATLGDGETEGERTAVVAGRGDAGTIAAYGLETGDRRWRYDTADDVGEPSTDSVFYLPYVVALETDGSDREGERLYAAARRYERDGETRRWHSAVLALDADGSVRWRYETDASPTALDLREDGERLAVGYNRCAGDHDNGLVVLEADTGDLAWTWDPGTDGDRRVGDVSFDGESIAVSSHGDKRGYLLELGGAERWAAELAVETEIAGETLYAYPNHVHANGGRVAFITGNTYAEERRETASRHPNEHRLAVFDGDGDLVRDAELGGFVHELATGDDAIVAPCAQNFRVRDRETHAVRRFDLSTGESAVERTAGIATAAAVDDDMVAAIEEPVEYHDESRVHGEYALRIGSLDPS